MEVGGFLPKCSDLAQDRPGLKVWMTPDQATPARLSNRGDLAASPSLARASQPCPPRTAGFAPRATGVSETQRDQGLIQAPWTHWI